MNLVEVLLKEHSKRQKDKIVSYIGNNPKRFAELIKVFLDGPYRVTQRAAWPLSYCVELHPELIKPHLKKIINHLKKPELHDSVKRNVLRLLQYVDIPKSLQGITTTISFELLADVKEPIAVKVFAMAVLTSIAKSHPDLKNELIPVIEQQLPYSSPAFVSRANKALKELKTN